MSIVKAYCPAKSRPIETEGYFWQVFQARETGQVVLPLCPVAPERRWTTRPMRQPLGLSRCRGGAVTTWRAK